VDLSEHAPAPIRPLLRWLLGNAPAQFVIKLVDKIGKHDSMGLAAETAYRFLFALFPFLIFVAAFLGTVGQLIGAENLFSDFMAVIGLIAPPEIYQLLDDWVTSVIHTSSTSLMTLGAVGALYGATGGMGTVIKGVNRAYEVVETRPFWQVQAMALTAIVALTILILIGLVLFTAGERLGNWLVATFGLGEDFLTIWHACQGPAVFAGFGLVLVAIYRALPNTNIGLMNAIPGAIVAIAGWVVLTLGFSFYLSNFGNYNLIFGSLGAVVVLMVWMQLVALILLLGGEINALLAEGRARSAESEAPRAFDADEGMERLVAELKQNRSAG
jgi:membrane protein